MDHYDNRRLSFRRCPFYLPKSPLSVGPNDRDQTRSANENGSDVHSFCDHLNSWITQKNSLGVLSTSKQVLNCLLANFNCDTCFCKNTILSSSCLVEAAGLAVDRMIESSTTRSLMPPLPLPPPLFLPKFPFPLLSFALLTFPLLGFPPLVFSLFFFPLLLCFLPALLPRPNMFSIRFPTNLALIFVKI